MSIEGIMSAAQFEQFFAQADADKSGDLDVNELIAVLKKRGYAGSDRQIKQYFAQCDTSGDGRISKQEYMVAMGQIPQENHMEATMRSVFTSFDKNGDGSIDHKELQAVFAEMGKTFSEADMKRMINLSDKDNSGTLEYEEFIATVFGRK